MSESFASLNAKIARLQKELGDDALMHAIGKMAKGEATKAASADLGGDPKFSGWAPTLATRYDILGKGKLLMKPTPRSAGPWTVAERGRNQGNASGFAGPSINRRTGATSLTKAGNVRRSRGPRARRWNGVTQGKGTASDAIKAIEPKVVKLTQTRTAMAIRRSGL